MSVVAVGSLNVDLTVTTERFPEPGETVTGSELRRCPGGKSANQAAAAARLGSSVRLVGAVGADDDGTFLREQAHDAGVDVTGVARLDDHATGSAMIVVNHAGQNTIIVSPGANGALRTQCLDGVAFTADDVLCLALEVPTTVVLSAARAAREVGARVLLNLSPYADVPPELLELTDVLAVNAAEAARLTGVDGHWPATVDRLRELGVGTAVVTLGGDGAVVLDRGITRIDAVEVDVVDTTGCGDAFTGATAHHLAGGSSLVEAARAANRAAAAAATQPGAQESYRAFGHGPQG